MESAFPVPGAVLRRRPSTSPLSSRPSCPARAGAFLWNHHARSLALEQTNGAMRIGQGQVAPPPVRRFCFGGSGPAVCAKSNHIERKPAMAWTIPRASRSLVTAGAASFMANRSGNSVRLGESARPGFPPPSQSLVAAPLGTFGRGSVGESVGVAAMKRGVPPREKGTVRLRRSTPAARRSNPTLFQIPYSF